MSTLVVVLLAILWASILMPGALRNRGSRSPVSSIVAFERSMDILAHDLRAHVPGVEPRPPGRRVLVVSDPARLAQTPGRQRTLRRRRQVLQGLVLATLASAVAAAAVGGWAVTAPAATGAALLSYVGLLAHIRTRELQTRRTVHQMPRAAPEAGGYAHAAPDAAVDF